MSKYYSGRVTNIVWEDRSRSFYILKMQLDEDKDSTLALFGNAKSSGFTEPVGVLGNVPGMDLEIGSWFGFEARWETDAKHGRQLKITQAPVIKDGWTPENAMSTLAAHGVSDIVCEQLMKAFGQDVVKVLDTGDEQRIANVPGISLFSAAHIIDRWNRVKAYFSTLAFLADAKVPKYKIGEVWSYFGDEAQDVLSEDPWRLVEIDGIRFHQADEVALRLGLDMTSNQRVRGAVLYACKSRRGMGHLYLTTDEMVSEVKDLVSACTDKQIAEAVKYLMGKSKLVLDRTTRPGTTAIYEPWMYELEVRSAELLRARMDEADPSLPHEAKNLHQELEGKTSKPYIMRLASMGSAAKEVQEAGGGLRDVAEAALEEWSTGSHIDLSDNQMRGALNALTEPVSILTGLPGTGKTTTLKAVVSVLRHAGVNFLLCAPTGIAAKRIASVTKAEAFTIHRAFHAKGWSKGKDREATYAGVTGTGDLMESSDGSGEDWGYNPSNPHPADVVIIDEVSMVDQHLIYRLLSSTKPTTRIVLVGDAAQLPSVGPGNVLRDMIASSRFPMVSLTEIFRQGEQSDIVLAAHSIFRGEPPTPGRNKDSDFVLVELMNDNDMLETIVKLSKRLYDRRENFQVLSPRHSGTLGVTNLNARLRDVINPKGPGLQEMRLGKETIREDDRVMVVKNDYKHGIYNGDVGKVAQLVRKDREVAIKLHGPPEVQVRLPFKKAPAYLRLAYAMTVHKSQGQEYDYIILPIDRSFGHQLQRNLFYTAITRAKVKVVLVGQEDAIKRSVYNDREDARNTLFKDRIVLAFT